jgi:hypothetical protein
MKPMDIETGPELLFVSSRPGKKAAWDILLSYTIADFPPGAEAKLSILSYGSVAWDYLISLAEFHNVAPLIAGKLLNSNVAKSIPSSFKERLERTYHSQLYSSLAISEELRKILAAFNARSIPVIVLKGTLLAEQLYENPGLRTVTDMDILVRPVDVPASDALLRDMGYMQREAPAKWAGHFHGAPYSRRGQLPFFVELHHDLVNHALADISLDDIWRRARPFPQPGVAPLVLSPEDTLIYLSYQFSRYDNQLLKYLCDVSRLMYKYNSMLDWDYIVKSAKGWQIETYVYYTLKKSAELSGTPPPIPVLPSLRPGACRRGLLRFYTRWDLFLLTSRTPKLRTELFVLVQALMMKHPNQMLEILSEYRGDHKSLKWLRSIIWLLAVSGWVAVFRAVRLIFRFLRR